MPDTTLRVKRYVPSEGDFRLSNTGGVSVYWGGAWSTAFSGTLQEAENYVSQRERTMFHQDKHATYWRGPQTA